MTLARRGVLVVAALLVAAPTASAVELAFVQRFLDMGTHDYLFADFDEDSTPDLASLHWDRGALAVALGLGDGNLGPIRYYPGVFRPLSAAVGDFDEDGHLDVAVGKSQEADTDIFIMKGDGLGGFSVLTSADVGNTDVAALAAADFDEDGHLDLVSASIHRDAVGIVLGRGDGSFSPVDLNLGIPNPRDLCAGDWNEDGHVDVAVASTVVAVLFGDGQGDILDDEFLPTGTQALSSIGCGDFDEDGHLDLVCSSGGQPPTGKAFVWVGDGSGGFSGGVGTLAGDFPNDTAVGDFDEDGHLDVVCSNSHDAGEQQVVVFLFGDGTGNLVRRLDYPAADARSIGAGDATGDGHLDVVLGSFFGGLRLLVNQSNYLLPGAIAGNVNASAGAPENVLLVNGTRGQGPKRTVEISKDAPFFVRMKTPPLLEGLSACYALYVWTELPNETTVTPLPNGWGSSALPMPPSGGHPRRIWNTTGDEATFGVPQRASAKASTRVVDLMRGTRKTVTVFLQGLIEDPGSPSGSFGVTNGITLVSR